MLFRSPSRHRVLVEMDQPARFVVRRAIEKCWPPLAAVSWPHPRDARYDLVHGLNAIPLTSKPFVTTFESTLPRALGPGGERVAHVVRDRLLRPNCRALIAMSQYARGKLVKANRGWTGLDAALAKVTVIYPHFDARPATIRRYTPGPTRNAENTSSVTGSPSACALRIARSAATPPFCAK